MRSIEEEPGAERVWLALYRLALARGDAAAADALLEEAIAAVPESATLQWTRAGALEREGDVEGAIAIYETLYERDSDAPVIANNLASLLSTHRDDDESLQRAAVISRRLRGSDVPQFQDTYGWIALRRGDVEEALANLEPAAAGMPDDPRVQHHYGLALAAAGRDDEALEVLTRRARQPGGGAARLPRRGGGRGRAAARRGRRQRGGSRGALRLTPRRSATDGGRDAATRDPDRGPDGAPGHGGLSPAPRGSEPGRWTPPSPRGRGADPERARKVKAPARTVPCRAPPPAPLRASLRSRRRPRAAGGPCGTARASARPQLR